jgi:hypothetical protein
VNSDNALNQFSQGFASSGGVTNWILMIVLLILIAVVVVYLVNQRRNAPKSPADEARRRALAAHARGGVREIPETPLNAQQQKVIYDLIDEFRGKEPSARAVPSAVLEKYSQFFFERLNLLKSNRGASRRFVAANFPLKAGMAVELDFDAEGQTLLIRAHVDAADEKLVAVPYTDAPPHFLHKGAHLLLNYSTGKHFLQGNSTVLGIKPGRLVVSTPSEVVLTSERRYARVVLKDILGTLADTTGKRVEVAVMDISLEGARVESDSPPNVEGVYQLTIPVQGYGTIGPIECVITKVFTTGSGQPQAGLAFLYLDVVTRSKLITFMKRTTGAETSDRPATP